MFFTHQHHKVYIVDQKCSENYLSNALLSLLLGNYPRKSFQISSLGSIQNQPSDQWPKLRWPADWLVWLPELSRYLSKIVGNWGRCILSPCLFNLYAEYIMQNSGLDEAQAGIELPVQVRCMILDAWGWCTGTTQREGMGRKEEGSGGGTQVYLWRIHFDIWQNQYNIVKFKNKIKC